ncbi:MAG: anthranilate/aminodeoxychorismate synthase component II, partial [Halohasta sp.]
MTAAGTDPQHGRAAGVVEGNTAGGPRVLVVDNYDSFVYNLVQYVGEFAGEVAVRRNDAV